MTALLIYAFLTLLVLAGAGDVLMMRIPNWLSAGLALLFLPAALLGELPPFGWFVHLSAGVGLFAAGYCLYFFGVFGGGDAKLMAGIGLWLGLPALFPFLLLSALAGGLLAVSIGLWSLALLEIDGRYAGSRLVMGKFTPSLPFGFALASGAILAMPFSWWTGLLHG